MHSLELALKQCVPEAAKHALTAIVALSNETEGKHAYVAEQLFVASKGDPKKSPSRAVSLPWKHSSDIDEGEDPEDRDRSASYRLGLDYGRFTRDVIDTLTYSIRVLASHPEKEQTEIALRLIEVVKSECSHLDSIENSK